MNKAWFVALLPLSAALATEPALQAESFKRIESADIPLEELAYSFLFVSSITPQVLNGRISTAGLDRVKAERAVHEAGMRDMRKNAAKLRQLCTQLRSARSGPEFAAVMVKTEATERDEQRQAARRVLSSLDPEDRKVVEAYVDSRIRQGTNRATLDYEALFASKPFPSELSNSAMQTACDGAAQAEALVQP